MAGQHLRRLGSGRADPKPLTLTRGAGTISPAVCQRCGECCRKGGPALHTGDLELLRQGVLTPDHLFTLRRGELARDQVTGNLAPLAEELVKIKGLDDSPAATPETRWACGFLDQEQGTCTIYRNRPAECRALLCFDTGALEAMYDVGRITRFDIVSPEGGLAELIRAHEEACSHERLAELARDYVDRREPDTAEAILGMLRHDDALREVVVERMGPAVAPRLEFYFGRPMAQTLPGLGLRLTGVPGRPRLMVTRAPNRS
jgi:Fe-S-cluster containining protein